VDWTGQPALAALGFGLSYPAYSPIGSKAFRQEAGLCPLIDDLEDMSGAGVWI